MDEISILILFCQHWSISSGAVSRRFTVYSLSTLHCEEIELYLTTCKADEIRFSWLHRSSAPRHIDQNLLRLNRARAASLVCMFVCFSSREIYLLNDCLYLCFGNLHFIELVIKIWSIVQPSTNLFALKIYRNLNVLRQRLVDTTRWRDWYIRVYSFEEKELWIIILWLAAQTAKEEGKKSS